MKRNVFGAMMVAGGLGLWTSVAGFADFTPATAKAAIATCAATVVLTDPATLTGEGAGEAKALNAETTVGLAEITAEANSSIDELAAEKADEDSAKDARGVSAQLTAIVDEACQSIVGLKAEYAAAIAELKAESTQPNVEKPEVDKPKVDKAEKPEAEKADKPEVRSTSREGND
jgi:chorismate mutase